MATIKSHTDIEQSKILSKILNEQTADMYYHYDFYLNKLEPTPTIIEEAEHFALFPKDIPCWSLASLLNVLPSASLDSSDDHHYRVHCKRRYTEWYDNPIDACVEMILKLHERKML